MTGNHHIVDALIALYDGQCDLVRRALKEGLPPLRARYPYLEVAIRGFKRDVPADMSFCAAYEPGVFRSSVTRPALFAAYLSEQLATIEKYYDVEYGVGVSDTEIPLPFVVRSVPEGGLSGGKHTAPDLEAIARQEGVARLAQFSALRTDFSLNRLQHYTGTAVEGFQKYILLTNYHRYVREFVAHAQAEHAAGRCDAALGPGDLDLTSVKDLDELPVPTQQMPAYHMVRADGGGVTLINIGVGPSNAKNITDHLAVLRPNCWLMVGHCGGLRTSQQLGDYVLAHSYVRLDHVLDDDVPQWVPIPCLAEVQKALEEAVSTVTGGGRARTGAVMTTDDRNWELNVAKFKQLIEASRAIAIDMESATVAANGYRHKVPYGTLLCVSDKPLNGEIKLQGMANSFYQSRVAQHFDIALRFVELVRGEPHLHSKKLRAFHEPLFR